MAKKKKRRSSSGKQRMSKSSLMDTAVQIGGILTGVVIGSQVKKFVEKKDAVSGTDLLGLDGETSKYTTPFLVCAVGAAITMLARNNKLVKNLALGATVAGGAGLVNAFVGKSVVALGTADDNQPIMLPGIGNIPMLPGIGSDEIAIPENYDYSLDPALVNQPAGSEFGNPETFAGEDDEESEIVAGIGLANII